MKKRLLLLCVFIGSITLTLAQTDRTFWFVAPDVSVNRDEPIILNLTALNNTATVTISMPANPSFSLSPKTYTIPANTMRRIQLSKADVENVTANQVNNKGLLITSDQDINAFYEVSNNLNPDKFTLKGGNALGTEFFVPSQNDFYNETLYGVTNAKEKIDIVATDDNTVITIRPTGDIVGHAANETFTITLNRGQTFCLEAVSQARAANLAGTYISSTKSIAVTISDDSIRQFSGTAYHAFDLIGDQLIPTNVIGTDYVAIKTHNSLDGPIHKAYVLATVDNTVVTVVLQNPNDIITRVLMKGEQFSFDVKTTSSYIKSTYPVYVYQVTAIGYEMGSAILPPIVCTGSQKVTFTRNMNGEFWVQILVRNNHKSDFTMREAGGPSVDFLKNISWQAVPGSQAYASGELWVTAAINLNALTTGTPYTIENLKGPFHLSILDDNGKDYKSMSYGYFSSYNSLRIDGPTQSCEGTTITLTAAGNTVNYNWYSSLTGTTVISTAPSITVNQSGKYWVQGTVAAGGCTITDTLTVNFSFPVFNLGNDTTICANVPLQLTSPSDPSFVSYQWYNQATPTTTPTNINVTVAGGTTTSAWLEIKDAQGCSKRDTINITAYPAPVINLAAVPASVCIGDTIRNTTLMAHYQWQIGDDPINPADTLPFIIATKTALYKLTVWNESNCALTDSKQITLNPLPVVVLNDVTECKDLSETFQAPAGMQSYLWSSNSTASSILVTAPSTIWVKVTDTNGCVNSDTAVYAYYTENIVSFGNDTSVCDNSSITITADPTLYTYNWILEQSGVQTNLNNPTYIYTIASANSVTHSGNYIISANDINGCFVTDTFKLRVTPLPDLNLGGDREMCHGDTIRIIGDNSYVTYQWTSDQPLSVTNRPYILVTSPGVYSLTAWQANGCWNSDQITVTLIDAPVMTLINDYTVCENEEIEIGVQSATSTNGMTSATYMWNTGATTPKIQVQQQGTYRVVVRDDKNCFAVDSINVYWHDPIKPILSDDVICDNTDYILSSPLSIPDDLISYQWFRKSPAGVITNGPSNALWVVNTTGEYILSVIDKNGCANGDSMLLTVNTSPIFDLGADRAICIGDSIKITRLPEHDTYMWNDNPADNNNFKIITTSQTLKLTVQNKNGCINEDMVNITANPLPIIDLGPDRTVCGGDTILLSVDSSFPTINWSTSETTSSIFAFRKGTYWVQATDVNGCTAKDNITLDWLPLTIVNLGPDEIICPVEEVIMDAGSGFASYLWHTGDNSQSIKANIADTVNVVRVQDGNGCFGWDTKMVYYYTAPEYLVSSDTAVCSNDTLILDAGEGYIDYRWSDTTTDRFNHIQTPGTYWVEVSDGCFILRDTISVNFYPTPIIAQIDTTIYKQVAIFAEGGTLPYLYFLNDGTPQKQNVFKNLDNGIYVLTVQDLNGCMVNDTITMFSTLDVDIPDFFTPNDDGINDTWVVKGLTKFPNAKIRVYDRYGKLLALFSPGDDGWDGKYLNRPMPSDTYWYMIELLPTTKIIKGGITLKR
jgi:gliding motility-associated-like protein